MTVSTTATRVQYDGNGTTTAFAVPFKFLADTDLVVIVRVTATLHDTTKTLTTHYAVSGAGASSGGTVTLHTPPESTETVLIYNNTPLTQSVDYVSGDAFPAETHEQALDKLTLQQQRTRDMVSRAVTMDDGDPAATGPYNVQGLRLGNVGTPTASLDAATKGYVDVEVVNAGLVIPSGVTANNSTEERSLGERWSERRSPLDFGAVGDGVADDSEAIQACLDAVRDYGGIVSFPLTKTFACKEIDLEFDPSEDETSPLIIEGNGCTLKAHSTMGSGGSGERLMNTGQGADAKHLVIRDLTFDGNNLNTTIKPLVRMTCEGLHLENCRFTNFRERGLDLGVQSALLLNCEFDNLGDTDRVGGQAIESTFGSSTTYHQQPRDIRIIGCHFHDLRWYGVLLDARRIIVEGCIFENMVDSAVRIRYRTQSEAYDVQIINNIVRGIIVHEDGGEGISFGIGIAVEAASRIRISGNQISYCDKYGIRLLDCAYADVSNNVIGNIGRSDNDTSAIIDGDTTFTIANVEDIGGTELDVQAGQKVVHANFPLDTFVVSADSGSDTVTTDVAATGSPAGSQTVTFITGGYCIALVADKSGSGTAVYADDRRLRNISITNNVFYDDNIVFVADDSVARSHRVSITRGGMTIQGEGERVENIVVRGNIFSPELFNNKQSNYEVFEHNATTTRIWKPENGNVVENNSGLSGAITKASAAWFPLENMNIGDDPTFLVTGSTSLTRSDYGRGGMKMTLIWATGATFDIANLYPSTDDGTFACRDNTNVLGFQAKDSITFECVETVTTDRTCDPVDGSNSVTLADSSALKIGMSVSGPGIPYDSYVGAKATGTFDMHAGGGVSFNDRDATATGTNVPLTFTSRTWHEVSRNIRVDVQAVSTLEDSVTPSVAGGTLFIAETLGSTGIYTNFLGGVVGQTITIRVTRTPASTGFLRGVPLELATAIFDADAGDSITLTMFETGVWTEISRSENEP